MLSHVHTICRHATSSKLKSTPPRGAPKAVLTPAAAAAEKSSRLLDSLENLDNQRPSNPIPAPFQTLGPTDLTAA